MAKKRPNVDSNGGRYKKYVKCGSIVAQDAAKALAMVRSLKKLINVEYKSFQVDLETGPNTTPVFLNLTAIAVGDDFDDRDGRKIKCFSIQLKGVCIMHETATTTLTRIYVFIDHANTGTAPVITDLFTSALAFNAGQMGKSTPQSNSRFTCLKDQIIMQSDSGVKMNRMNFYKRLNHHIQFTGVAATDEGLGTIWCITSSDEATNVPTLEVKSTFKWIDN